MMIRQNVSAGLTRLSRRMLIAFLLCLSATLSIAQVRDAFKLRGPNGLQGDPNTCIFSLHGDFTMIANINLWAASGTDSQTRVNNSTNMVRVDLDGIASTTNSSMSELKLYSSCSKIVYAGLYWTAKTSSSVSDAAKKTVKIKGPGASAYTTLTSPMYSRTPGDANQYVCFTDVTQYVQQQGVGQYWVADIALTEGADDDTGYYAGWGMVVIYEDSDLPLRNVAMFDGYAYVASGTLKYSIPVSGFKSAQSGPVKVKLGFMAGEGDAGYSGDWCQMRKATAVGDVNNDNDWIHLENPTTPFASQNFWRSRVTNDAGAARNPNRTNNLGFDAFVFTADNTNNQFIGNNQTSTAIRYGTSQDQYVIFNMTMAVDAYEPAPEAISQVNTTGTTYVAQRTAAPGETLTCRLNVTNQGNEPVLNTKVEVPIPFNTTFVPGSIVTTFDASLSGATATYDPAAQKIVVSLGTLPVPPTTDLNKVYASVTYQLKTTTDCYYLKNSNACLRDIGLQGTITGTGAITGVAVNKKTISGYQGGACAQSPITTPTTVSIVVPTSYTACDSYVVTTPNLRICPGTATSIPATTIRNLLTLPSSITYVFNSAADGSGTVYNDNNPFPVANATYYAIPVNTVNTACSAAIPFNITILSVTTPPNVPTRSITVCPSDLPRTLVATATSTDYTIFWYTQPTGGTAVGSVTVAANTVPGTYTYYVAQGYDAGCQSSRVTVTVTVNPTPATPSITGPSVLCGGLENTFSIVSPVAGVTYEWAMDNAPVGVAFKNSINTGTAVVLTTATTSVGAFTIKVRAKDNTTGCYGSYRTMPVTVSAKPATPSVFTGSTEVCEGSVGNIYTLTAPVGTNYEWTYSGTGYTWANGSNTTQSVELQFATGATSGVLSVRAKNTDGCYSDAVTQNITVNPRPAVPASVSAANICVGQHVFVNINSSVATLKYQVYSGTTPVGPLTAGNGGVLSIDIGTFSVAGSYNYTVKSFNDKCYSTGQASFSFTVLSIPATPVISSGATTCYGTPPVIRILNATPGIVYNVYNSDNSLLNTVTANATQLDITINDTPTATKTYTVTASNGVCSSPAAAVSVTVRSQLAAPVLSADGICAGQWASIIVSNPPLSGGSFDNSTYQYKVYGNAAGTDEIALLSNPSQVSSSTLLLRPDRVISGNTTLYVRLVGFNCNGPLSPISIKIAARPAPSVVSPVVQCLDTRALVTIHNTVQGNHYRVYTANNDTLLRDFPSPQSGDFTISIQSAYKWHAGTVFNVVEAIRNDTNSGDICVSPSSQVVMQSGTPAAPTFTFNPAYTCSGTTATLTINNTLQNYQYYVYGSQTGSDLITSVAPGAYLNQYPFTVSLPSNFSGSVTYWMEMKEINNNDITCVSARTPVNILLATPATPTLSFTALTVCRSSVPVITVNNAQKDVLYTIYNSSDVAIAGPVTASANGNLNIPITGLMLTGQQTYQYYVQAKAPASQNSCLSGKASFTLTDGEPVMPAVQNVTVCHGSPIAVTIPNPVSGYTYLVYDAGNNLVGVANASGSVTLPAPSIPNPDYPDAFTSLNYYVKVQSATCLSETSTSFKVQVNRTTLAGVDLSVNAPVVCKDTDGIFTLNILSTKLINAGDLTIKWYNNSNLTELIDTQVLPSGTTTASKTFSGLTDGTYVYSVTAESALQGMCQNKPEDAVIATLVVKPHATAADISALDAVICNGQPVVLEVRLDNPEITNPVFNWYGDFDHTVLVASDTSRFSPVPNLTTTTSYYVTVHNDDYCENQSGDDEWIEVTVNDPVLPPLVSIAGNTAAICAGSDLILKVTPANIDSISGYELWESGMPVQPVNYSVDVVDSLITVFAPTAGIHKYTVLSQFYQNNILCVSDSLAPAATVSVIVNDSVASPSFTLDAASVCKGDTTIFHVTYTGVQPTDYMLMNGTGEVDRSLYTISSDMQTITLFQSVMGHHSYTLISLITANGIACQSVPSAAAEGDLYPRPTAVITNTGVNTLCKGSQAELSLQLTGTPPFTYTIQAVDVNNQVSYVAQNAVTNNMSVVLNPTPLIKTVYQVTALSDGYCSALESDLSSSAIADVYPDLHEGALLDNPTICNNTSPNDLNVTLAFDGNITNYHYTWQVWNGNAFVDIQPMVNTPSYNPGALTTGVYRYQRTVTDGCETKTVETTITVRNDLQAGSLIAPVSICNNTSPGELSLATPTGGNTDAYAYSWYQLSGPLFDISTLVANTPTYTPANLTTGVYRYRRVVTDGCQTHTAETTITVYSDLNGGSLVAPNSICLENSFGELSSTLPTGGNASNYTYSWQLWDGSAFVNVSPAVATATYDPGKPDRLGDYIFQRTTTDGCQTATASVHINVYSDLNPGTLVADTTICNNTSPGNLSAQLAMLCGSTSEAAYQWYSSDGNSSWTPINGATGADYDPGNLMNGIYHYQRTATDGIITHSVQVAVTVLSDLQSGSLIAPVSICNNTSVGELNADLPTGGNVSHYSYTWQKFNGTSFENISPAVATATYNPGVLTTGTHRYQRTVTDGCQIHTAETTVTVYSDLNAGSLVANATICLNNSPGELSAALPLGGNASSYSYSWQMWDGAAFTNILPEVTTPTYNPGILDMLGDYLYQRTVTDGCQTAMATAHVAVFSDLNPGALAADTAICNNTSPGSLNRQAATLCGSGSNITYQWYSGDGNSTWTLINGATGVDYNPGNLSSGMYHYQRAATDGTNIRTATVNITVYDNLMPGTLFADMALCNHTSPGNLSLEEASGGNTSGYTYVWQQSTDGVTFTNIVPTVTTVGYNPGVLSAGMYYYRRIVTDGCQTAYQQVGIAVYDNLNAGSLINPVSLCLGTATGNLNMILPSGGNTSNYTYTWQTWNGNSYVDVYPSITTADYNPGIHTIPNTYLYQRTVSDGCQTVTATVQIGIYSDLNPGALAADTAICNNTSPGSLNRQAATLCGGGSNISYQWNIGDGNNSWSIINGATGVDYNPGVLSSGTYYYQRSASDGTNTKSVQVTITVFEDLQAENLVAPMAICNGTSPGELSLSLLENTGRNSYIWQKFNGTSFENISPAVTTFSYNPGILTSGIHRYQRKVTDGCQTRTVETVITVYDDLSAGSLIAKKSVCLNSSPGELSAALPSGGNASSYSYTWQLSTDGVTFTNIVPAVTTASYNPGILSAGNYYYRRTVSDGCQTATATVQVGVYSDLSPGALVADTTICNGATPGGLSRQTANLCGGAANITYQWYIGDSNNNWSIINGATGVDYNPGNLSTGSYQYQRRVTDGVSNQAISTTITVLDNLTGGKLVTDMALCSSTSPGNLSLQAASGGNTSGYSYTWQQSADGITFTDLVPVVATADYNPGILSAGMYYYRRTVSDGCQTATQQVALKVYDNLNPGILVSPVSLCLGTAAGNLNQTLPSGGNASRYTYTWQQWNGSTYTDVDPAATTADYNPGIHTVPGTYLYQRTISDGCQTATATVQVGVYSDLNPGALAADTTICSSTSPGNLNRQAATLCGGAANISYQWYVADAGLNWTAISGATTADYNPSNLSTGIYQYQRRVSDGVSTQATSVTLTVLDNLTAGKLATDMALCSSTSPGNLSLQAASGGNASSYSYTWQQSADGVTFNNVVPAVTTASYNPGILSGGTYYYRRTVTDGCQTTTTATVQIGVYSDLNPGALVANMALCSNTSPGNLSLQAASGGNASSYTYVWQQSADGVTFTDVSPAVATADYNPGILSAGTYYYRRMVTDGCQTATITVQIGVYSDLNPGMLREAATICNNTSPGNLNLQAATLCGGGSNISYQWYIADAGLNWTAISGAVTADYNPGNLSTGIYQYQRKVSDGVNTQAISTTITVLDDLAAGKLVTDMMLCSNTSPGNLSLQAALGGNASSYSYVWQQSADGVTFTNVTSAVAASYNPGILSSGTYYYRRTVTDGCQTATLQVKIVVPNSLNGGSLVAPMSITPNTSPGNLSQTLPSGGNTSNYTYSWQTWNGSTYVDITSATTAFDYNPGALAPNIYRYQRTVTDGCQTATAATEVAALANLNPGTLRRDTTICYNTSPGELSRTLASGGSSGTYTYTWQLWDGIAFLTIDEAGNSATYNPGSLVSGIYRFRRTAGDGVTTSMAEVTIVVHAAPEINATLMAEGMKVPLGNPIYIKVTPDFYRMYGFTYNGNNTLQATNTYAIHQWTPNANHLVNITVEDMNGCVNALDMNFSGPPVDLPNIITPDNDGFNDNLLPGYNIEVFNRWGSRIYSGTDGWDGTYRGKPVAVGTYFYIVHVTYPDGTTSDLKSYVFVKR